MAGSHFKSAGTREGVATSELRLKEECVGGGWPDGVARRDTHLSDGLRHSSEKMAV